MPSKAAHTTLFGLLSVALLVIATGCSGTSSGSQANAIAEPLIAECDSRLVCTDLRAPGSTIDARLHRVDGSCYVGVIRLDPGHEAFDTEDGVGAGKWTATETSFSVCEEGNASACIVCIQPESERSKAPSASSSSEGKCEGYRSCSSANFNSSECVRMGCNYWNDTDSCMGSPTSCSAWTTESYCRNNTGCTWKK